MSQGPESKASTRPGVLSLNIREKAALYAAYMPSVKGGGLFIPTVKAYRLGDEVFMLLSLLDDPNKIALSGKVIWVTYAGAQGNKKQGIGVQFAENEVGRAARLKIEGLLAGTSGLARPTHTM